MARYLTIEDGREYLWDFDENRILLVTYGDTENIRQVEFSTDDTEGPTTWTSEVMTNLTTGNKYVQVPNEFLNGEYSRLVCYVIAEDETGQHTRTKEIFRIKKRQQPEDYEITFTDRVYIRDLKAIAERYRDQAKSYSESASSSSTQAGQHNAEALASKNAAAESERNAGASMVSAQSAQHAAESARNDANAILTLVQSKGTEITNFVTTSKTELETQKNESLEEVRSVYAADLDELKGDLGEYKGAISEYHKSVNLFDKTKITDGKILSSQNAEQSISGYFYTDYIEVKSNTKYAFQNNTDYLGANGKLVCLYDNNKNFKGSYLATVENGCCTFTTEAYSNKYYVRVNGRTSNKDTFMFIEGESIPAYEPYFEPHYEIKENVLPKFVKTVNNVQPDENGNVDISQDVTVMKNPLYGKKLALNGDSICYGAGSSGGYGAIIAQNNNMTVTNNAQTGGTIASGTTYSGGGNRHWICRTIENMPTDADYYILEGGSNDVALGVPIGNLSSGYTATLDDTTFYGAMESVCKQIITKFKGKKYGVLIVHQMKGGIQITNAIYTAIIECCNKWGIPYLDLAKNCVPFGLFEKDWGNDLSSLRNTYTADDGTGYGDGWHPNEECYKKYYVPKIEAWLKTL